MDMHSLYFVGYAAMATVSGLVIAWAQYMRQKNEGIAINYTVLKVIFAVALAMWAGAALSSAAYATSTTTTAVAGFVVGIILSLALAWQLNKVVQKIDSSERALKELATRDALTDLWNLRIFHETLFKEMARAERYGHPLSVVLLDIDHFNHINTTYSHKVGDMVLQDLGRRLLAAVRPADCVCRFGGEEVVFILPATDAAAAELFAQRLYREILPEPILVIGGQVTLSVSMGIASYGPDTKSEDAFLSAVTAALAAAKAAGGNCSKVHGAS